MSKILDIKFYIEEDKEGYLTHRVSSDETNEIYFYESELAVKEHPEDMFFYRDLFSGDSYIRAIKLGMKLAKEGYDDLNVIVEETKVDY